MGYFKKQLRRGKARKEVATFTEPLSQLDPAKWTAVPESPEGMRAKYVRFRIDLGDDTSYYLGLFQGTGRIEENIETPMHIRRALRAEYRWFNRCLPVPRNVHQDAVFWFVVSQKQIIEHAWTLVRLAKQAGAIVLLEASDSPGRIVYRDDYQVGAIRFKDACRISEKSQVVRDA